MSIIYSIIIQYTKFVCTMMTTSINSFRPSLVFAFFVAAICCMLPLTSHAFVQRSVAAPNTITRLNSSTDTSTTDSILSVSLEKPLGLVLEEVEEGQPRGVFVLELGEDGSAAASEWKDQLVGLRLASVMGQNVQNLDFDAVMDQLIAAPSPLNIDFLTPPEDQFPVGTIVSIKVLGDKDEETVIEAKVGDNLRQTLLDNDVEVYKGLSQKLGNCGGGGQCGFCAADFVDSEGWEPRSEYEDKKLAKTPNARLTCFNNIQGPATIRL